MLERLSYRHSPHDAPLTLDGRTLTIDDVASVARFGRKVCIADEAYERMAYSRVLVDVLLDQGEKVYGLTTGFGILRDVAIDPEDTRKLQQNLIRSHACGVGEPFSADVVRASMLLRINTLCRGNSGVRPVLVDAFVQMINDGVVPYIPAKGSLGASGDLAPLSHLALVLMGDPHGKVLKAELQNSGKNLPNKLRAEDFEALPADPQQLEHYLVQRGWQFRPVIPEAKEGLALNNGTQVMAAIACLVVYDAWFTLRTAELAGAASLEAQRGVRDAYDPRLHQARDLRRQAETAQRVLEYCRGSQILDLYLNSAHLQRAAIHLRHALRALREGEQELTARGLDLPSVFFETCRSVQRLHDDLQRVLPRDVHGRVEEQRVSAWAKALPREQIALFNERLKPLRRQALSVSQSTQQLNFPHSSSIDRAVTELVETVAQLKQAVPDAPLVQDDYSFRCFPQVLACTYRALDHCAEVLSIEINSATDNPLLFPPEPPGGFASVPAKDYGDWLRAEPERMHAARSAVIGGGNFHGEPLALTMDYLCMALAEAANIAERRIAHLVDRNHSRGLPPFLIESSGLNSGFMIPQYTAAALVSENKVLCHPASVDSIPTSANAEDHVSMGTIAARKCAEVLDNVRMVVAIELLTAYQGLMFREPLLPGAGIMALTETLAAAGILRYTEDRVMYPDMHAVRALMDDPRLLDCLIPL